MGLIQLLKSQFLTLLHLIFFYVFLASGLIVNLLQLLTLPLWLVSKKLARKINIKLCYCMHSQLVVALEWWSGSECTLYTDPKNYPLFSKENAIAVMNHCSEIDFMCGWTYCERLGVLGASKVLAKHELIYVPIIGWLWYCLEIVFCKRKWEEDRTTVAQSLQNLHDYPENFWFLLFCEGTRFTPEKHKVSMQVAESKGLPKLKYHLLPRTKGFYVTVQNLRGNAAAVYDCTLNFRNKETPSLRDILNGKKCHADLYVRRIPLELIPEDEAECAAWLHKLYQEKDSFQEHYVQKGCFPGPTVAHPRRPWALINWICWACVLLYPLGLLLVQLISSGSVLTILVCVIVACAASWGGRWMVGQTETNKGSSYGNKEVPSKND